MVDTTAQIGSAGVRSRNGNGTDRRTFTDVLRDPVCLGVLLCLAVGAVCVIAFGAGNGLLWQTASVGLLVAAGALVVGGTIGFVFGIPRAHESYHAPQSSQPPDPSADEQGNARHVGYSVNTNLQQISDWLTKILVGATLVQIGKIHTNFNSLAGSIGKAFHAGVAPEVATVFAGAMLVYFLVGGFLLGYLCTRIYLGRIFVDADASAIGALRKDVTREVTASLQGSLKKTIEANFEPWSEKFGQRINESRESLRKAQADRDIKANDVVDIQLSQAHESPYETETVINAVVSASPNAQEHIFSKAVAVVDRAWLNKTANWRDWIGRTVPVFQGLVKTGHWHERHRLFAQLGYALKNMPDRDWDEAKRQLETAVATSRELTGTVAPHYSFNLALCEVAIEKRERGNRPSPEDVRQAIVEALSNGVRFSTLRDAVFDTANAETEDLRAWLANNDVTIDELGIQGPAEPAPITDVAAE